jgi:transglutaminase-like putative cysteine protease
MKTFNSRCWLITSFFCFISFYVLIAQKNVPAPIAWGDIPPEHINASSGLSDSNATAIILCDYGLSEFDNDLHINFTRHRRIKIINTKGYNWGTHDIRINNENNRQRVSDIDGTTYTFDKDGKRTAHDMKSDAIFEEEVEKGYTRVRFTLPALSPGCIIEYRYTVVSKNLHDMPEWNFQYGEPILWSELRVQIPEMLEYVFLVHGTTPFSINERKNYNLHISRNQRVRQGDLYTERSDIVKMDYELPGVEYRWIIKDVSAFREEPFMTTVEDYRKKISFKLAKIQYPDEPPEHVMTTWDKVVHELNTSKYFGKQLDITKSIKQLTNKIVDTAENPLKQMELLCKYIQKSIEWNGEYTIFTYNDFDEVIESKKGNSAEIGLLLVSFLRAVGIESYPIITSTRSHGNIVEIYPFLSQFNHVITYAKVGNGIFLLDATDNHRSASMLPPETLNHLGLLVTKEGGEWVSVEPEKMYSIQNNAMITIDENANISGSLQTVDADYSAYKRRSALKRGKVKEFISTRYDVDEMGFVIDTFRIVNSDQVEKPFLSAVEVHSESYAQKSANYIYFNPVLYDRWTENPFKLKGRTYPADLTYRRRGSYTLNLTIPETFMYKEIPKPMTVRLKNGGGEYRRMVGIDSLMAQYVVHFEISKDRFEPEEYTDLQDFFDKIVAAESELFVLEKRPLLKK